MGNITDIIVRFERTIQPKDYESAKVCVELRAAVEGDSDAQATLDRVGAMAKNKALEMLGLKSAPAETVAPAAASPEPEAPKQTRTRKAKDTPAVDPAAIVDTPPVAETTDQAVVEDPAAIVEETPAAVSEEWEAPGPAVDITDVELNERLSKKNQALRDPPKIRTLIASFNPTPAKGPIQARQIPQADRARFLRELDALK